jgi:RNA-splicing ligase RtcB
MIDGNTLQAWGFKPGQWFKQGLEMARAMAAAGASHDEIFKALQALQPAEAMLRTNTLPYSVFLDADTEAERANLDAVNQHMDALMRVPTIVAGAVMPDACPSGKAEGTIPVGGAVACKDAIHPGFHSSDICCSVAVTVFRRDEKLARVLDAMLEVTHFGPGGRAKRIAPPREIMQAVEENHYLKGLQGLALGHFASQGDGNHFAYVGQLRSSGQPALVTHHGSRGLGAALYKQGMAAARKHTAIHAPKVPWHNAWIQASSRIGEDYWNALQIVRAWTKASHFALHDLVAARIGNAVVDRFWNEHNFVFQRTDGLFYHGKGATPSWSGFSPDDDGRTLIPLNMAEPILIVRHKDRKDALGFAPHGAGRNMSRKAFLNANRPKLPAGIDVRFFCGKPDPSELPEAYKNAAAVRAQIEKYGLAEITDEIVPYGTIMAGEWKDDAPWRKKRASRSSRGGDDREDE